MAGEFPPVLSKSGAMGSEVPFHLWCSSRGNFRGAKDLFPNFPKLARKVFSTTFAYKVSPTKIIKDLFLVWPPKRSSCVFLQTLGAIFEVKQLLTACLHRFSENQTFCGALAPTAPPPPTQLLCITVS